MVMHHNWTDLWSHEVPAQIICNLIVMDRRGVGEVVVQLPSSLLRQAGQGGHITECG